MTNSSCIQEIGEQLLDSSKSLTDRFRALFTLKNLGGSEAIDIIAKGFYDPSALLKHELAYCLGQMQDKYAVPVLTKVLEDKSQEAMVRHEAGEALGAIGASESLEVLRKFENDSIPEVSETCQLAIQRIEWLNNRNTSEGDKLSSNPYHSVDPAPPSLDLDIPRLKGALLDENRPLFERYRAMFSLRNTGGRDAVLALAEGLKCKSALFRHEIAYVLGQMQHEAAIEQLTVNLADSEENPMVRHECAEALGSIAKDNCLNILEKYSLDHERVVKESCIVALDMLEHEQSDQFQYANTMAEMKQAVHQET
ncbi:deoxyhypusine hydroxylase [Exaiptasia diaphana]|uniref:Deoxyhypusine hydroxylase n=1 Tax=Exaiptasia diaphana TaxID=2652724 RepID=A0A913XCL6_EXADI|nr:deoxyhypusine hydroxylase [Exaiptasia diaphana]KXJ29805.1 Deoxyhypusine hydroxylase [Exaiptasia diaphana]